MKRPTGRNCTEAAKVYWLHDGQQSLWRRRCAEAFEHVMTGHARGKVMLDMTQ